jgi:hypothetical protein
VNNFVRKVKDPGFKNKLVVNFDLNIISFELKTPTKDYKLSSVEHRAEGKKYAQALLLPEVTFRLVMCMVEILMFHTTNAVVQAGQT